jgi:hypothetical protein
MIHAALLPLVALLLAQAPQAVAQSARGPRPNAIPGQAPASGPAAPAQSGPTQPASQPVQPETQTGAQSDSAAAPSARSAAQAAQAGTAGAPRGTAAAPAAPAPDPAIRQRAVVRMMISVERTHRERVGRLERLIQIFDRRPDEPRLRLAIELRHRERERYDATMAGYREELGPELYARVRTLMDAGPGSEPPLRAKLPPPPPPPPSSDWEQEQKQRSSEEQGAREKHQAQLDGLKDGHR